MGKWCPTNVRELLNIGVPPIAPAAASRSPAYRRLPFARLASPLRRRAGLRCSIGVECLDFIARSSTDVARASSPARSLKQRNLVGRSGRPTNGRMGCRRPLFHDAGPSEDSSAENMSMHDRAGGMSGCTLIRGTHDDGTRELATTDGLHYDSEEGQGMMTSGSSTSEVVEAASEGLRTPIRSGCHDPRRGDLQVLSPMSKLDAGHVASLDIQLREDGERPRTRRKVMPGNMYVESESDADEIEVLDRDEE